MTTLGGVLFPPADYRRTNLSTIAWWESRRWSYNLIVGATGVFTLVTTGLISRVPPALAMPFDWRPIAVYAVLANLCYSAGSLIELALLRVVGKRAPAIGPALFRQGIAFSVGLTLLPIPIVAAGWVIRAAMLLLR